MELVHWFVCFNVLRSSSFRLLLSISLIGLTAPVQLPENGAWFDEIAMRIGSILIICNFPHSVSLELFVCLFFPVFVLIIKYS